jgi:hypothetical protein
VREGEPEAHYQQHQTSQAASAGNRHRLRNPQVAQGEYGMCARSRHVHVSYVVSCRQLQTLACHRNRPSSLHECYVSIILTHSHQAVQLCVAAAACQLVHVLYCTLTAPHAECTVYRSNTYIYCTILCCIVLTR